MLGHGDPSAPALLDDARETWLSHGDLAAAVARAAAPMAPGLVFLFAPASVAAAVCYLAALRAGAAVALFEGGLPPGRADALIARYRPGLVLGHPPADGPYALEDGLPLPAWRRTAGDAPVVHPDLAVLLSTSGSTGSPKLVRLSRRAVASNAAAIRDALGITPEQRAVLNLPLSYSYGLSVLNSHLAAGASVLISRAGVTSPDFWRRLDAQRVTSMPGVPVLYAMLRRLDLGRLAPPSLTTLTQAGGGLAEPLVAHFHELMAARGGRLFVMYGATEATARMTVLDPALLPAKPGSAGRPIPGGRLEIVDGEVIYHGANVMMGYAEAPEDLARGDDLGGRLATGDLGRLDADGCLWITGRARRIAKVNGQRLNLDEIEALAARFGPTAALEGDNAVLLVSEVPAERAGAMRREIAAALALLPVNVKIQPVARLPLSANGKVDLAAVRALVAMTP